MPRRKPSLSSLLRGFFRHRYWRQAVFLVVTSWNRYALGRIAVALLATWLLGSTLMYLIEGGRGTGFDTWGDSLWSVWASLFNGLGPPPETFPGRVLLMLLVVAGVALAGLFTATVASILVERYLRRKEVATFEMDNHLVLCNWGPRGLEWIREVHSKIVQNKRPVVIV